MINLLIHSSPELHRFFEEAMFCRTLCNCSIDVRFYIGVWSVSFSLGSLHEWLANEGLSVLSIYNLHLLVFLHSYLRFKKRGSYKMHDVPSLHLLISCTIWTCCIWHQRDVWSTGQCWPPFVQVCVSVLHKCLQWSSQLVIIDTIYIKYYTIQYETTLFESVCVRVCIFKEIFMERLFPNVVIF